MKLSAEPLEGSAPKLDKHRRKQEVVLGHHSRRDGLRVVLLCDPRDSSREVVGGHCAAGDPVELLALRTGMAPPATPGAVQDVTQDQSGHPSGVVSPLNRLVQRVPAGVGQLHLPGYPQHAHDVH